MPSRSIRHRVFEPARSIVKKRDAEPRVSIIRKLDTFTIFAASGARVSGARPYKDNGNAGLYPSEIRIATEAGMAQWGGHGGIAHTHRRHRAGGGLPPLRGAARPLGGPVWLGAQRTRRRRRARADGRSGRRRLPRATRGLRAPPGSRGARRRPHRLAGDAPHPVRGLRRLHDTPLRARRHVLDPDLARFGHLRRVPGRALRPARPPLSLPLHQLHELRPALHHHRAAALRPAGHLDAQLCHVPGVRRRVRRRGRPPLPCPARCLLRVRAVAVVCRCDRREGGRGAG